MGSISHQILLLGTITIYEHLFCRLSWSFDFDLLWLEGGEWKVVNK